MSDQLTSAVQHWQELRRRLVDAMPELEDDPDCLLDTLEGETDVHEQLAELIRSANLDKAMAQGIKGLIDQLKDRAGWLSERHDKKCRVCLNYMADLGLKKVEAYDMTILRRPVQPGCVVTDETLLPEEFMRVKREPDKAAIRKALQDGQSVPGAQLGNQAEILHVKI